MPRTLTQAVVDLSLRAEYKGAPGFILPLTTDLVEELGADNLARMVGHAVNPGQLVVSWNENGQQRGAVLNPNAGNDLTILLPRNDGEMARVYASDLDRAAIQLVGTKRFAEREIEEVNAKNAEARVAYEAAVARGEPVEAPVDAVPTYSIEVFKTLENLVKAVDEGIGGKLTSRFADRRAKQEGLIARFELGEAINDHLTQAEKLRIAEKRDLQEQIARLRPENAGVPAVAPANAVAEGERRNVVADALAHIGLAGRGARLQMYGQSAERQLAEVTAKMLTTDISGIMNVPLERRGYEQVMQILQRHPGDAWGAAAIERVNRVLNEKAKGYEFHAEAYHVAGADILVVADPLANSSALLIAMDSVNRADPDIERQVLQVYTRDDVPSDEDLHALRLELQNMQYGLQTEEINFAWNDAPALAAPVAEVDEDDDLDDDADYDNPLDFDNGPGFN